MENRSHALIAGIFTLVLLAGVIAIALWFNSDNEDRLPYEIATNLSVPGLNPQAAVRYRGLDVGRVDAVMFDPQVAGRILIRFSVSPDTPMTKSTYSTLSYQGVTGLAFVQLDDDGTSQEPLPTSRKNVARITMRPSLLDTLQLRGLAILKQTEEVAQQLNLILAPENQKAILTAFKDVSSAANSVTAAANKLTPTLDKLPTLANEASRAINSVNTLTQDVRVLSGNLNDFATKLQAPDGSIARLGSAADQVGSAAGLVETEAAPMLNEIRTTVRSLNRTLENFNQRPQGLIFGNPDPLPGPGESGFSAPAK